MRQGCPLLQLQFSTRSYSQNNYVRRRYKKHSKGKEEVKTSLFADNMISCIESAKDSTQTHTHKLRTTKLMQQDTKSTHQNSPAFLYSNKEQSCILKVKKHH